MATINHSTLSHTVRATAAAWSYDCPCILQSRPDTSYKLFMWQNGIASIFVAWKHRLNNWIKAFESYHYRCCPSSCSSKISHWRTFYNNCREGTRNPQSRGVKEGLPATDSCPRPAFWHQKVYRLWARSDAAMLSCHQCMDGWQLPKHSLALNQAAPLPRVPKHWHHSLEEAIHCRGNWESMEYTSKSWKSQLRQMRWRDGKRNSI